MQLLCIYLRRVGAGCLSRVSPTLLLQSFQIYDTCRCLGSHCLYKSLYKSCRPISGQAQVGMDVA